MIDAVSEAASTSSSRVVIVAGCEDDNAPAVVRRFILRGDRVVCCKADPGFPTQGRAQTDAASQASGQLTYVAGDNFDRVVDIALDRGSIEALINGPPAIGAGGTTIGGAVDALHGRIMQVARHMRSGGQIVNIMSSAGRYRTGYFRSDADADGSHASRAAADGAVFALTRQLGFELARHRIRVNAISLGWIRSGERGREWAAMNSRERKFLLEEISLGRAGEPDEVAAAVEFLASDASSYVTCNAIDVNGGWWTS